MYRRRRPVVINLTKTDLGYAVDNPKKEKSTVHFDVQSRADDESSSQGDPFRLHFTGTANKQQTSSTIHNTFPVTSEWFHLDCIHPIEIEALP